jgi:hypothetical protein
MISIIGFRRATSYGSTLPASVLARADEVIERGATSSSWLSAGIGVTFTKSCQQDVPKSLLLCGSADAVGRHDSTLKNKPYIRALVAARIFNPFR